MIRDLPPVRPEFPILGMTLEDWAAHYQRQLSDWFRQANGRYADSTEWAAFLSMQYDYQQTRDEGFSEDDCE